MFPNSLGKTIQAFVFLVICTSAVFGSCFAQSNNSHLIGEESVQSKNWYLLTLLEQNENARKILENDPKLTGSVQTKLIIIQQILDTATTFSNLLGERYS
ncbi:MAG TPA: hypothetical protein VFE53_04820 [Mucilaginibacter sp.]|jgi:hypothetical protein|nr:hypothetical protein [Mucilaginibacter sp.]